MANKIKLGITPEAQRPSPTPTPEIDIYLRHHWETVSVWCRNKSTRDHWQLASFEPDGIAYRVMDGHNVPLRWYVEEEKKTS